MILTVKGEISQYYVQTLCLLFFPGSKFGQDELPSPENPEAHVSFLTRGDDFVAEATLSWHGSTCKAEGHIRRGDLIGGSDERLAKVAVGRAVFAAGKVLLGYTPPWGILTGVRPAKVASELVAAGNGILRSKQLLRDEYFVNPKKAALAVSIASTEQKLVKSLSLKNSCSVYIEAFKKRFSTTPYQYMKASKSRKM